MTLYYMGEVREQKKKWWIVGGFHFLDPLASLGKESARLELQGRLAECHVTSSLMMARYVIHGSPTQALLVTFAEPSRIAFRNVCQVELGFSQLSSVVFCVCKAYDRSGSARVLA